MAGCTAAPALAFALALRLDTELGIIRGVSAAFALALRPRVARCRGRLDQFIIIAQNLQNLVARAADGHP